MLFMYDAQKHLTAPPRFIRPDLGPMTEAGPGVPWRTTETFSVSLLSAPAPDEDVAVVSVRGEIDLATAPMLREVLSPVLERDGGPVVVDLSEVQFMDSTGVHVLIDTIERLEPQSRRLAIACREDSQVHRLLAFAGLLDTVAVHRSRESAVFGGDDYAGPRPAA